MRPRVRPSRFVLVLVLIISTICAAAGQGRLRQPSPQRQSWIQLPGGASVEFDGGDLRLTHTTAYVTPPSTAVVRVKWDVARVRGANGALFQIARGPFAQDGNPSMEVSGLVSQSRVEGKSGVESVSVGAIADELGYAVPQAGRLSREPQRLERGAGTGAFMARGGQFAIFVRVVPIRSPAEPTAVGLGSSPLKVLYSRPPPLGFRVDKWVPKQTEAPPLECVGMTYRPARHYCTVHSNPSVCKQAGETKSWWEKTMDMVTSAWNWVAKTYGEIKNKVIDLAASAFPIVPREVFAYALDAALASCGMPPNLPNVDQLMSQGADYLAAEIVSQVGPPVAGDLAKDQLKQAIVAGAKAAAKAVGGAGPDTPCDYTIDMPFLILTVRNTSSSSLGDVRFAPWDTVGLFNIKSITISNLKPGVAMPLYFPMLPNMFSSKYVVNGSTKDALWWEDYNAVPTQVIVNASNSPYGSGQPFGATTGLRLFNEPFVVQK